MAQLSPEPTRRRANPILRYISRRVTIVLILVTLIFAGSAACAIFAPITYQQIMKIVQNAGLKTYTIILGITGNPALKVTTYEADVTASVSVTRDMGIFSILYGEGAQIIGTVRVAMGADLKNNQFGVLSCDIDTNSVRTQEQRAPLSGTAFDIQKIKQEAYDAFEKQSAQLALTKYWALARERLRSQFTTWALGVAIPEQPTLTDCPANAAGISPTPAR